MPTMSMAKMPFCSASVWPSGLSSRAEKTGSPSKRGKQLQTICARRSTRAEIVQLPITARSSELISAIIPFKRQSSFESPRGQAMSQIRRRSKANLGNGVSRTDAHRQTAMCIHGPEAVLVGQVVADEDRPPSLIRRFVEKSLDHFALPRRRGKDFCHSFSVLNTVIRAQRFDGSLSGRESEILLMGGEAPVNGNRAALVLDQDAFLGGNDRAQPVDHLAQGRVLVGIAHREPPGNAMLEPMQ